MTRMEKNRSLHHELPRSRGGSNEDCNLNLIRNTTHRAIHTLYANQMIAEQLITTIGLSEKALRPDVKERLLETLTSRNINDAYERYVPEAIKF